MTDDDIRLIQSLLGYPPSELLPNSQLRRKIAKFEDVEQESGLDLSSSLLNAVYDLQSVNDSINEIELNTGSEATEIEVKEDYRVVYGKGSQGDSLRKRKGQLISYITNELGLNLDYYSGTLRRI